MPPIDGSDLYIDMRFIDKVKIAYFLVYNILHFNLGER